MIAVGPQIHQRRDLPRQLKTILAQIGSNRKGGIAAGKLDRRVDRADLLHGHAVALFVVFDPAHIRLN